MNKLDWKMLTIEDLVNEIVIQNAEQKDSDYYIEYERVIKLIYQYFLLLNKKRAKQITECLDKESYLNIQDKDEENFVESIIFNILKNE